MGAPPPCPCILSNRRAPQGSMESLFILIIHKMLTGLDICIPIFKCYNVNFNWNISFWFPLYGRLEVTIENQVEN